MRFALYRSSGRIQEGTVGLIFRVKVNVDLNAMDVGEYLRNRLRDSK
jgi:hypothetical protein